MPYGIDSSQSQSLLQDVPRGILISASHRAAVGAYMIANHIPHLQGFVGNEVARHHQRTGLFHNPVFTLPTLVAQKSQMSLK